MRHLALLYGMACYVLFLGAFLYAIAFVGDLLVPKTIDRPTAGVDWPWALLVDTALLLLFAVPHSVMARPWFKLRWTRIVPQPVERSTYVLISSLSLGLLYWQWIPIPSIVWDIDYDAIRLLIWALFWAGWTLALVATFLIDHFDLFGLRQVYLLWMNRTYEPVPFRATLLYRWVRHPLILGFLIAFWAAPTMTAGRLLFAAATTVYCLIALQLEERDLLHFHGDKYAVYRRRVRMLAPIPRTKE